MTPIAAMTDCPTFRADALAAMRDIGPLVRNLHRRGRIPAIAATAAVTNDRIPALVDLHRQDFPIEPGELAARLLGTSRVVNYDRGLSRAIMLGARVAAAGLAYRIAPDGACLCTVVTAPDLRRGWATPMLKHACFEAMVAHGVRWFEFKAMHRGADTLKHARRLGASVIDDQYLGMQFGALDG